MIRSQFQRALLAAAMALAISAASSFAGQHEPPAAHPVAEAASCPDASAADSQLVPAVAPAVEASVTIAL